MDLAFVAELPPEPARTKPRRRHAAVAVGNQQDPEALAHTLEAHPDYRVLRRLQPRLHWPAATPGAALHQVLLLDTETTGLDPTRDKIIELALLRIAVDSTTGLPVGTVQVYDGLEDPGVPIPPEIEALTGIHSEMVRDQRLDEAHIATLLAGVDVVIAHNAGFDRPFVEARLPQFCDLDWACSFAAIDWKKEGHRSAKLEHLVLALGYFFDAHRADMDCHALLTVLVQPLPRLQRTGLAHLLAQATRPSYLLQASNAPFDAKDLLKARGYRWNSAQRVWFTHLDDAQALQAELDWLKVHAYNQRPALVQVATLDAKVRYASRPSAFLSHSL